MSGKAFLSPLWYRVAGLRPTLKPHARLRRHRYRGQVWYVVHDPVSGRFNRLSPAAYELLGLMDGVRTTDQAWQLALRQLGDDAPGQEEVVHMLAQLHAADLLACEITPDAGELFERYSRQARQRRTSYWKNPFSIRIPLWDPDRFLERTLPYVRPLMTWPAAVAYVLVVATGLVLAGIHREALSENTSDQVLSLQNLALLWICFPVVKLFHELGHAYVTKAGGGEVHDIGVMLLVFTPVPYVDATASAGFRSKWRRALAGAAGMLVELFIAALAMMVWAAAEPGWVRAVAFNVMLIAGISTVVFNGNPLLRFDGYYILADIIEMPNLAQRGQQYWRALIERSLFRIRGTALPQATPGERRWMLFYTPAAFVYRILVLVAIIVYVAGTWFVVGVVLAIYGVVTMLAWPVAKGVMHLLALPRQGGTRTRALAVSAVACLLLAVLLFAVPAPHRLTTEGVVWLPPEAHVRAGADGFVQRLLVAPGSVVTAGTPLVASDDPVAEARLRIAAARVEELEAKLDAHLFEDPVQAELARRQLARERAAFERERERVEALVAVSGTRGRFVLAGTPDLTDRFFRKGETIGYVTPPGARVVRVVVSQDDVDLVRSRLVRVEVRLAEAIDRVLAGELVREVPAARAELPSAALATAGGGALAADPRDPKGAKTLQSTFQFDVVLPREVPAAYGGRAYVRFVLTEEPLGLQWYRRARQAFLARFHA